MAVPWVVVSHITGDYDNVQIIAAVVFMPQAFSRFLWHAMDLCGMLEDLQESHFSFVCVLNSMPGLALVCFLYILSFRLNGKPLYF